MNCVGCKKRVNAAEAMACRQKVCPARSASKRNNIAKHYGASPSTLDWLAKKYPGTETGRISSKDATEDEMFIASIALGQAMGQHPSNDSNGGGASGDLS